MRRIKLLPVFAIIVLLSGSCDKDEPVIDTEYPVIDVNADGTSPVQCSVLKRGEKLAFQATFTDNIQLGSYSLDIHHNFDHHTHSTEVNDCNSDPVKKPVKPFLFIKTTTYLKIRKCM